MENILIKSAKVIYPGHELHDRIVDVHLKNGKVERIGESNSLNDDSAKVIDAHGCYLSLGFFDLNVNFGEPGLETKETLLTGTAAAAAGGFTGVALQPNTKPPIHSRAEVSYIVNQAKGLLVDVYPLGAISHNREGVDLAEMYDMSLAGAVAFTDGDKSVAQAGLMSRALLYSKGFDALVFSFAEDSTVAGKAKMNEGVMSTYLGMKGNPNLAEELMVSRDLYLAAYNGAPIHFSTISTAGSISLIREAKSKGLQVTCDVAAHHLVLSDEAVADFDSNYKVKPPLRTVEDITALHEGLKDGTIDAIVSQHTPHEVEYKRVEFEVAKYGIISLQTLLPMLLNTGLPLDLIVQKLTIGPREVLKIKLPIFEESELANLVLFDPNELWHFNGRNNRSKSSNSPYLNQKLKGKVLLTVNNGLTYLNE
ncbi:dihydroorotase [Olivibacter sitiensis]|uniref:dihydroorotase n=1 Tax=Olivibacter sitiensis TaxID=376470 RepID=UPI000424777E|nr:dihydroorotase [Olivibacter sitiensis]